MNDMLGAVDIKIPDNVDHTGRDYRAAKTDEDRDQVLVDIEAVEDVGFDLETWTENDWTLSQLGGAFDPRTGLIAGIALTTKPYTGWYVPLTHTEDQYNAPEEYVNELMELLQKKHLIIHNAGFETKWILHHMGIRLENYSDTQAMAYLVDPNGRVKLDILIKRYLNENVIPYDDTVSFNRYEVDGAATYAAEDTDTCYRLWEFLKPKMSLFKFLFNVENQLTYYVGQTEMNGVPLDPEYLKEAEVKIDEEIDRVSKELWVSLEAEEAGFGPWTLAFGKVFNSPKKLGTLLFEQLKLPVVEKSRKTGNPSTAATALKKLEPDFPVVREIQYYKELVKLRGSFIHSLPKWVNPVTGRIHGSFLQHHVPTGRFASKGPNMQQIPKSDVAQIRRAFIAPEGWRYVAFDYSQVEMRVFASEVKETTLIKAFESGVDLHSQTTSTMLGIPIEEVTSKQRQIGKTLNFGLIYGMSERGLAYRIEVTEEQAANLIEAYFRGMPRARVWIDNVVKAARQRGGINTHFGRWRALPEINSNDGRERGKGERGAVNSIIQGTAADIMKIAMVRAGKSIEKWTNDQVQMVLTIHDDLTFLVHESVTNEEFVPAIKKAMEFPIKGYVPLKVDVMSGLTWGDLEDWDSNEEPPPAPKIETPAVAPIEKPFTVLECRDGLNEEDLESMKSLFEGGGFRIEMKLDGQVLTLPASFSITEKNIVIWNQKFGIEDPEPEESKKLEFA